MLISVFVKGSQQAHHYEEGDYVEEGDSPEDLLGCLWEGFAGVGSFRSCETNKFSSAKGKGGSDEY